MSHVLAQYPLHMCTALLVSSNDTLFGTTLASRCGFIGFVLVACDPLKIVVVLFLQGRRMDIADAMAAYVKAEAFDKLQERWDTDSWPRIFPTVPRQHDGCSCGLYATAFADCLGLGVPLQHCGLSNASVTAARATMLARISHSKWSTETALAN